MMRKFLPYVVVGSVATYHLVIGITNKKLFDLGFGCVLTGILVMMLVVDLYLIPKFNRQVNKILEQWRKYYYEFIESQASPSKKD